MHSHKKIAIIGGGPGGLTLARILHLHRIHASIFERDEHASARTQGGSLDLHRESGQFAIRCAGLSDEFQRIARYQDQGIRIYDKHGKLLFEDNDNDGDRPEVDRTQLRQMLLDSLPDGMIRWNHELRSIQPQESGTFDLTFQDGAPENFDLVVGADGAWSRLRPLVSDARPVYSGVTFVELHFEDADKNYPEIAALVGHGMMFALGDSKALLGHRDAGDRVTIYAGQRVPEDWITTSGMSTTPAVQSTLGANFSDWSENLSQCIHKASGRLVPRAIYGLPIGHRWQHRPGITLLGDAAHLMSPFSGEGANLAMQDAADLALELASAHDWDAAIQRFEWKMFARAEAAAMEATALLDVTFSDQGLSHILEFMQSRPE